MTFNAQNKWIIHYIKTGCAITSSPPMIQTSEEIDLMFTGGTKRTLMSHKELLITADEWEIPPEQVIVEESIGEGAFGEVLKGTLKGPLSNPKVPRALKTSICIPVAIKMLKSKPILPKTIIYIIIHSICLLITPI